jgi:hypothetical protein
VSKIVLCGLIDGTSAAAHESKIALCGLNDGAAAAAHDSKYAMKPLRLSTFEITALTLPM